MSILSRLGIAASILDHEVKRFFRGLIAVITIAGAGSTQADATPITTSKVMVTGADGAVGVKLPVAETDMTVEVVNTVADQDLLVYPNVGEVINAIAANSAFTVAAGTSATFYCDAAKHWYVRAAGSLTGVATTASTAELNLNDGAIAGTAVASKTLALGAQKNVDTLRIALLSVGAAGIEDELTAGAGGTEANALALDPAKSVHRFTIVATAADSAKMPAATGSGNVHVVINDDLSGATSMQVFGLSTDTIDDIAEGTGVAIAATKRRIFVDTASGKWTSLLSA